MRYWLKLFSFVTYLFFEIINIVHFLKNNNLLEWKICYEKGKMYTLICLYNDSIKNKIKFSNIIVFIFSIIIHKILLIIQIVIFLFLIPILFIPYLHKKIFKYFLKKNVFTQLIFLNPIATLILIKINYWSILKNINIKKIWTQVSFLLLTGTPVWIVNNCIDINNYILFFIEYKGYKPVLLLENLFEKYFSDKIKTVKEVLDL